MNDNKQFKHKNITAYRLAAKLDIWFYRVSTLIAPGSLHQYPLHFQPRLQDDAVLAQKSMKPEVIQKLLWPIIFIKVDDARPKALCSLMTKSIGASWETRPYGSSVGSVDSNL